MSQASTAQSIRIAAAHHQAGRLAEARAIYQQILAQEPNHPDALHLLGAPVVTLRGRTAVGRAGVSILSNIGLSDWIADNPQQYVNIAQQLAGDLPRLAELRSTLRPRMLASPLMDGKQFAHDIEAAFRRMWAIWCSKQENENGESLTIEITALSPRLC